MRLAGAYLHGLGLNGNDRGGGGPVQTGRLRLSIQRGSASKNVCLPRGGGKIGWPAVAQPCALDLNGKGRDGGGLGQTGGHKTADDKVAKGGVCTEGAKAAKAVMAKTRWTQMVKGSGRGEGRVPRPFPKSGLWPRLAEALTVSRKGAKFELMSARQGMPLGILSWLRRAGRV